MGVNYLLCFSLFSPWELKLFLQFTNFFIQLWLVNNSNHTLRFYFIFIVNFSDNSFHFCNFYLVLFQICLHFSFSSNIICYLFWSPFRFFLMFSFWGLSYPFFSSFTLCDSSFLCHGLRSLILSLTSVGTAFHGIALNCVLWTVGLTLEDRLACIIAKTT